MQAEQREARGETAKTARQAHPERTGGSFWEVVRFAVLAALIVIPIRYFIAQPFVVSGASMVPTFDTGDYLIIDELTYRFEDPKRGDVVVFKFPLDPNKFLIKRVVGLPGETIEIQRDTITIKNAEHPDGFVWRQGATKTSGRTAEQTITLNADEYFVMGDNRDESADSRLWGPLPRTFIRGRPVLRLFPVSQITVSPGAWSADGE